MYQFRITVCTPTYNRAYIIDNLYQSLKAQTFRNFEWLVIDDGSVDRTAELFSEWCAKNSNFPIQYVKKENGGKHTAVNEGLRVARGEIFFVVDSDDILTPDALEKIDIWFQEIEDIPEIKGVVANRGTSAHHTPNAYFEEDFLDATLLEMNTYVENGKRVLAGERAIAFFTDFHKEYYYPVYENERFVTEAVVYNRMAADGYKMRFYNDIIWIYEYREDGLTKVGSSIFLNNPRGYGLWLREKARFEHASTKEKLKMYYTFTCDLSERLSAKEIAQCIGAPRPLIALFNTLHKLIHLIRK